MNPKLIAADVDKDVHHPHSDDRLESVFEAPLSPDEEAKLLDARRRGLFDELPELDTIIEWKIF